jgi:hypothetical protein
VQVVSEFLHVVFQLVVLKIEFLFSKGPGGALIASESELVGHAGENEIVEGPFTSVLHSGDNPGLHLNL